MFDREKLSLLRVLAKTLFVASGFAGAANAAVTGDSRLIEAARTQDAKAVRAL